MSNLVVFIVVDFRSLLLITIRQSLLFIIFLTAYLCSFFGLIYVWLSKVPVSQTWNWRRPTTTTTIFFAWILNVRNMFSLDMQWLIKLKRTILALVLLLNFYDNFKFEWHMLRFLHLFGTNKMKPGSITLSRTRLEFHQPRITASCWRHATPVALRVLVNDDVPWYDTQLSSALALLTAVLTLERRQLAQSRTDWQSRLPLNCFLLWCF